MSFNANTADWNLTGSTTDAGTGQQLIEDGSTANRHSFYQDIQDRVDAGLGTSAIIKARIIPQGRTKCWIGCRQNNGLFMQSFDLQAGTVLTGGINVTSASITDELDGSFTCLVTYSGTFSTSASVMAIGALINDDQQSYDGSNGLHALTIIEAQLLKGTSDRDYEPTDDRQTYYDSETGDGSQDADMPAGNPPNQLNPDYLEFLNDNGLTITDFAFDLDNFTILFIVDWNGSTTGVKGLGEQYDGFSGDSWRATLSSDGKFSVLLSSNGTAWQKNYVAVTPLDVGERTMCTLTWDGSTLRMYYNDIELTVAGGELTKTTDDTLTGNIFDSSQDIVIGASHFGKFYRFKMFNAVLTPAQVAAEAAAEGLSGLPGSGPPTGGGGNLPTTLQEMIDYLVGTHGVSESNIFYVNNSTGNDTNAGTAANPWLTIQKAASTLTAGQACIIQGAGGRFYESVTLRNSGTSGNRIIFAGDPENPAIIDGSEEFTAVSSGAWSSQTSNRWRANYGLTRDYTRLTAYHDTNCTTSPPCIHESVAMSHQMIYNHEQLCRISQASVPATMAEGTCFFEVGTGSYETPQYVWIRLPGDVDPNTVQIRNTRTNSVTSSNPSGGNHLFDWNSDSPGSLWNGMTGGVGSSRATGRNYIGVINLHFNGSVDVSRDIGGVNIRGTGWFLEWCSFSNMNAYGFGLYGDNHTIKNCKTNFNGQGNFRAEYLQNVSGTTRIEQCEFRDNNVHTYPIAWEAGNKFSNTGAGGRTEIVDCMFINDVTDTRWIGAGALWWDISNGPTNAAQDAYLVERCIFDNVGRWAVFMENNAYYLTLRDCGIFQVQDMAAGGSQVFEGAGIKFSGSGRSTITQNAVVRCDGCGQHGKTEGGGDTLGQNNDVITNNVYVENNRGTPPSFLDKNFIGGPSPTEAWSTSQIDGNVFVKGTESAFNFGTNDNGTYSPSTDILATFEGWHGGTGNAVETDPLNVVASVTDRKTFFDTSGGNHPTKGPQNLVHFEDLPNTGWIIPT